MSKHLDLEYVVKITAKKQMKLETNPKHKLKLIDYLLHKRHIESLYREMEKQFIDKIKKKLSDIK